MVQSFNETISQTFYNPQTLNEGKVEEMKDYQRLKITSGQD